MMSSCWTLRLNRRKAFSSDSPSWIITSATQTSPPHPRTLLIFGLSHPERISYLHYCPPLLAKAQPEVKDCFLFCGNLSQMAGKLGASEGMSGPGGEHLFGARHPLV